MINIRHSGDVTFVGTWSRVWVNPWDKPRRRFIARHVCKGHGRLDKSFPTRKAAIDWLLLKGPIP